MTTIDRNNAPHYTWGAGCDGWHLVVAPTLSIIQERMPPGSSEVRHRHASARQFFFLLEGTLEIEIAGDVVRLEPQQGVEVPPGVPHQVRNRSSTHADFVVVSQPPSHGDRVEEPALAAP
ncbi:cupin domain-containing protein [Anaeromyxobacter sp. SG64]|uniref:cupin domain-containing protein n=1 Tax=Anaeromyxobacter sp. SG64 TaxID=2925409 RepID=UPI001F5AF930|nr:cupin domain-containing protein [Anaeromyxobacter sp. SG64]